MLKETLGKFLILHGVLAAIVVQENGEIIESMQSGFNLDETTGRFISVLARDAGSYIPRQEKYPIPMVFMEFSGVFIIMGPLIEEFYLVIVAKNTANIALITLDMKNYRNALVAQL